MAKGKWSTCRRQSVLTSAIALSAAAAGSSVAFGQAAAGAPNIVVINIDDMGYADLAPYNTDAIQADTPTATRLAGEGLKFTNFYVGSPICSASRAALLTGQYSSRWGINSFIDNRANNKIRDTQDFISLEAPMISRTLQQSGYATANVGKWHLGGGRDVGYDTAPVVTAYGFDQSLTQFEGLGDRVLYQNPNGVGLEGLSQASKNLGTRNNQDTIYEIQRDQSSAFYVDRAIQFVNQSKAANPNKPFFLNLAFDDVHTPYDPKPELLAKYQQRYPTQSAEVQQYLAVMENLDTQIGRFVDAIDGAGLGSQTLILLTADNGPSGPTYNAGSAGGLRGSKGSLYEGGIKEPLIARWTGRIDAGGVNNTTVLHATDLFPSLSALAGLPASATAGTDGQNLSGALVGDSAPTRNGVLFWDYGRNQNHVGPAQGSVNESPNLALRDGRYKFLIDADGEDPQLFDLQVDPNETTNLAGQNPGRVHAMARQALALRYEMPSRIASPNDNNNNNMIVHLRADDLSLASGASVSSFADADTGDTFNGNLTQVTSARQPKLIHSAINGRKAIRFDGDDYLASSQNNSLPNTGRGMTIFMVATGDQSGQRAARAAQVGAAAGINGTVAGADLSDGETGVRYNNGAAVYDADFDPSKFHIFVFQIDSATSYADAKLFIDGTTAAHTFTGSATAAGTTNFGGSTLELLLGTGRLNTGAIATTDYFLGDIAELMIYNEQMSELRINLVANYLSSEYGLPFTYDTTSVVPEPATVSLVALAGASGLGRRRRRA